MHAFLRSGFIHSRRALLIGQRAALSSITSGPKQPALSLWSRPVTKTLHQRSLFLPRRLMTTDGKNTAREEGAKLAKQPQHEVITEGRAEAQHPWGFMDRVALFSNVGLVILGHSSLLLRLSLGGLAFYTSGIGGENLLPSWLSHWIFEKTAFTIQFDSAKTIWSENMIQFSNIKIKRTKEDMDSLHYHPSYSEIEFFASKLLVQVSFEWFFQGKGPIKQVQAYDVVWTFDRRKIPEVIETPYVVDEKSPALFHLDSFTIRNADIRILYPNFRPLHIHLYKFDCDRFRDRWVLLDLLSTNLVIGTIDSHLFSLQRQSDDETLVRIESMNTDLIGGGEKGQMKWVHDGRVDQFIRITWTPYLGNWSSRTLPDTWKNREVMMNAKLIFKNLYMKIPLSNSEMSYMRSAAIQPMLFYLNNIDYELDFDITFSVPLHEFLDAWNFNDTSIPRKVETECTNQIAQGNTQDTQPHWFRTYVLGATVLLYQKVAEGFARLLEFSYRWFAY